MAGDCQSTTSPMLTATPNQVSLTRSPGGGAGGVEWTGGTDALLVPPSPPFPSLSGINNSESGGTALTAANTNVNAPTSRGPADLRGTHVGHGGVRGVCVAHTASVLAEPSVVATRAATTPLPTLVPYKPVSSVRKGRVVVVIDGPYFERCVRGHECKSIEQYQRTTFALQQTLAYIGDLFQMDPIAYWFDTGHEAFTEFLETAMPLHCREAAFRDAGERRQYLIDEMNSTTGKLSYVVARLVGSMKRQRGYTPDGPGHVWVQSGVDVAMATCLMEHFFQGPNLQGSQIVLLSGDSDLYPAVKYCNSLRRSHGPFNSAASGGQEPPSGERHSQGLEDQPQRDSTHNLSTTIPPVRMCGTSKTLSKIFGLDQDLFDFLPRILLDEASHTERGQMFQFDPHVLFE